MSAEQQSSGVQELIQRLSQEGVVEGQRQAEELLLEARRESSAILEQARQKAEQLESKARQEAEQYRNAVEQALQLAVRDTVRSLQFQVNENFRHRLKRLVAQEIRQPDLLREMILAVVDGAAPDNSSRLRLLLPAEAVDDEELRRQVESGEVDELTEYVQGMLGESIREGLEIGVHRSGEPGIRVQVVDHDIEINMTADAISDVISQHLLPRFRSIMKHA